MLYFGLCFLPYLATNSKTQFPDMIDLEVIYWLVLVKVNAGGFEIDRTNSEKLPGVKVDQYIAFDNHISDIRKKAGRN